MKKIILLIITIACLSVTNSDAQKRTRRVTLMEFDIGFGMTYPLFKKSYAPQYMGIYPKIIPCLYYEFGLRLNIPDTPHSIGVQNTQALFHKHKDDLCEQS